MAGFAEGRGQTWSSANNGGTRPQQAGRPSSEMLYSDDLCGGTVENAMSGGNIGSATAAETGFGPSDGAVANSSPYSQKTANTSKVA